MKFKKGQRLKFNIYGTITNIEGDFVKVKDDKIIIKITKDFIEENIGREQFIHKDFLTKL